MDKVIVTALGAGLVGLIWWFFFGKKDEITATSRHPTITVDGGYRPATVKVFAKLETQLTFIRKDANSCLEEVVIPDLKIKKFLPLDQEVTIPVTFSTPGEYGFHCGMNMFHGTIKAV